MFCMRWIHEINPTGYAGLKGRVHLACWVKPEGLHTLINISLEVFKNRNVLAFPKIDSKHFASSNYILTWTLKMGTRPPPMIQL